MLGVYAPSPALIDWPAALLRASFYRTASVIHVLREILPARREHSASMT